MKLFPYGHATHPQWEMAAGLVLAQLRAHMTLPEYASAPHLGLVYITDHYACLLYTSDAADDMQCVDLGGRRIIKKKKFFSSRRRHTRY